MKGRSSTRLLVVAVVATALTAGLIERGGQPPQDPRPLSTNGDARGLLAARRYLEGRGARVRATTTDTARAALHAGVVLVSGPTERALRTEEIDALEAAARAGAVVLFFAPGGDPIEAAQPALARRWHLQTPRARGQLVTETPPGRDRSQVVRAWAADPLFAGGKRFLARVRRAILARGFTPIAGSGPSPAVLRKDLGAGRIYLLASPTLIENHRIDLADNLYLLEGILALAHGRPILFDDEHHLPPVAASGSILRHPAFLGAALQGLCALALLLLALGRRLGPIRPLPSEERWGSEVYVEGLAALYRRAGIDDALRAAAYRDLRATLWRRAGVAAHLPEAEAGLRLARRTPLAASALQRVARVCLQPGHDLLEAVRAIADLEAALETRGSPSRQRPRWMA